MAQLGKVRYVCKKKRKKERKKEIKRTNERMND